VAYSASPDSGDLAEDAPAHVSFWDGMEINPADEVNGPDIDAYRHRIRMQLMISAGRSDLPTAYRILTPFVPLYVAAFNANLKLKATVSSSALSFSPGIVDAIYPGHIAVEFILTAVQKEAVSRAA
jgi:hypothetical protein